MGTTIHFPQSAYESGLDLTEKRPVPGADGQAGPEPAAPAIPGMPDAAEGGIPPESAREAGTGARPRPLSGWKPAISAALWGLAAAGVLLGCREAAGMGEWLREAVLWAVSIGVAGWCGLSPAGQPGIVLVLLLRAMGTGAVAAEAWQGDPQAAVMGLIPYALSLTLLISEASDGMMASFRVVRRLRGGKAAGAGKYLLRTALRLAGAGVVWVVWAWGTGRI